MIFPKRITAIPTLNASGIAPRTQVVIPEIPAAGYPISLYLGGQVVGLSDMLIDGLIVSVDGDATYLQWELLYYVGREIKPVRVGLAPIIDAGNTRYLLTELPYDGFPVALYLGGQVVGLSDYSLDGMSIRLAGDWSHLSAEAEYYSGAGDDAMDMQAYLDGLQKGFTEPVQTETGATATLGGGLPVLNLSALLAASGLGTLSLTYSGPDLSGVGEGDVLIGVLDPYVLMMQGSAV